MWSHNNNNLAEALNPDFGIPGDILFRIFDSETGHEMELTAHRYYLARASPVLRALLFNSWYETKDVISIDGTTVDAFKTMLDYVYNKKIDLQKKTTTQLQEIEQLSLLYHLPGLTEIITRNIKCMSKSFQNSTFGIPTDVAFNIIENGKIVGEGIEAHKHHLALATPVFKAQFFGPVKETQRTVQIKGTTRRAFKTMIDFIYGKQPDFKEEAASELFEIVNLGEMYDIHELKQWAVKKIREFPITEQNVIELAFEAENHAEFKDISENLLENCTNFLARNVLKTRSDIINYSRSYINSPGAMTAFSLLARVPTCQNCYQEPCLKGEHIRFDQIVEGSKVSSFNDCITGTVLYVTDKNDIKVKCMDGMVRSFNSDGPPRDADVVQNPVYFHNSYFTAEEKTAKGGIYWNC